MLFIETCRDYDPSDECHPVRLEDNNVLLLLATSFKEKAEAGEYISKLAEILLSADGAKTLDDMHLVAKAAVQPDQTPQKLETVKRIVLQNWTLEHKKCKTCYDQVEEGSAHCRDCLQLICNKCLFIGLEKYKDLNYKDMKYKDLQTDILAAPSFQPICKQCKSSKEGRVAGYDQDQRRVR